MATMLLIDIVTVACMVQQQYLDAHNVTVPDIIRRDL